MNVQRSTIRRKDTDTPYPNPLPYTTTACRRTPLPTRGEARGGIATASHSYGEGGRANTCFCETNPPILAWKTAFINQRDNGLRDKILPENGGFVLENEPTGRGFCEDKRGELGGLEWEIEG